MSRRKRRGGQPGNQNARKHGAYSRYVPVVALKDALKLPPGDLRLEIAAARAVLKEVLEANLPTETRASAFEKVAASLARLLAANRALNGDGDALDEVLDRVLEVLDLAGEV